MKKVSTLFLALVASVLTATAQGHGAMKFAGKSEFSVSTAKVSVESDTVQYLGTGGTTADITIPTMKYNMGGTDMVIPSFTIHGATFGFDMATMTATFADQTFTETITADGEEKTITGKSLVAAYKHDAFNTFTLTITFSYGRMPMPITYSITAYYIKAYTDRLDVTIDKTYTNESVTYNVRTYPDGEAVKMDVEVPTFELKATTIGDLTSGGYTVKGLAFDADKGGYYRDYSADGLKLHFHTATIDGDYPLNSAGANNMLVTLDGKKIKIINHFKPGAMPFLITSTFPGEEETEITGVLKADTNSDAPAYNLAGQRVNAQAKGLIIRGGKKFIAK